MISWAQRLRMSICRGWTWLPRHSSWLPGAEVEGVWDGSWCCHVGRCFTWLLSLPTWGVMYVGPTCRLHHPSTCGWQTRGHSPLTDTVLHYLATKLLQRMSPPTSVHTLLLSGKGIESFDGHCPVQSFWVGWCRLQTALSLGGGGRPLERFALV
jgi:hypothetical protein